MTSLLLLLALLVNVVAQGTWGEVTLVAPLLPSLSQTTTTTTTTCGDDGVVRVRVEEEDSQVAARDLRVRDEALDEVTIEVIMNMALTAPVEFQTPPNLGYQFKIVNPRTSRERAAWERVRSAVIGGIAAKGDVALTGFPETIQVRRYAKERMENSTLLSEGAAGRFHTDAHDETSEAAAATALIYLTEGAAGTIFRDGARVDAKRGRMVTWNSRDRLTGRVLEARVREHKTEALAHYQDEEEDADKYFLVYGIPHVAADCFKNGRTREECAPRPHCRFISRKDKAVRRLIKKMNPKQFKACIKNWLGCRPAVGYPESCFFSCPQVCRANEGCAWVNGGCRMK